MTLPELDERLGELVATYQLVDPSTLDHARAFQAAKGCTLAGALTRLHLVADETIARLLEELVGVRAVDPFLLSVYQDFVESMSILLPHALIRRLVVFPAQTEINAIQICMLNPSDGWTIPALETISECR